MSIKALLTGDTKRTITLINSGSGRYLLTCIITIVLCGGLYGMSVGLWRSPLQSVYVFVKFPLMILITVTGNALINWMLCVMSGIQVSLKQSMAMILSSFTIACAILASFTPITLFLLYNLPSAASEGRETAVSVITVLNVLIIALAGIIANFKLHALLKELTSTSTAAKMVLIWLAVNLFLGAQVSWNLRPFIGNPSLEVEFIRKCAFKGSFYEDVYNKIRNLGRTDGGGQRIEDSPLKNSG